MRRAALGCLALVALIALTWAPALDNGFVAWDDDRYVTANPLVLGGLTLDGVRAAFSSFHDANWVPLTLVSHMLDVTLFGLDPRGHHAVNLLLHALAAVVLLLALWRATGAAWRSLAVALLFALHPLRVESVAWVAERKDVLAALFWMLTLAAWVRYAERRRAGWYAAALALFATGLLAKQTLVSLPVVLLLLDAWPLRRIGSRAAPAPRAGGNPPVTVREALLEKAPFFALALAAGVATLFAQAGGGAIAADYRPWWFNVELALRSCGWYLGNALWPADLAFFYPLPRTLPAWQVAAGAAVLVAGTVLALRERRRRPYLAVGWFWYLAALAPMSGLLRVGLQSAADRYATLPLIGAYVALAWGAGELAAALPRRARLAPAVALAAAIVCLAVLTRRQIATWRSSEVLFTRALAVTTDNWMAQNNLGGIMIRERRFAEALPHLLEAVRIEPEYASAHCNLGIVYSQFPGGRARSMASFARALEIDPLHVETHLNLGMAYLNSREYALALREAAFLDGVDPAQGAYLRRFVEAARGAR
jgi:tetratricopeptide (TPR) repeat protein